MLRFIIDRARSTAHVTPNWAMMTSEVTAPIITLLLQLTACCSSAGCNESVVWGTMNSCHVKRSHLMNDKRLNFQCTLRVLGYRLISILICRGLLIGLQPPWAGTGAWGRAGQEFYTEYFSTWIAVCAQSYFYCVDDGFPFSPKKIHTKYFLTGQLTWTKYFKLCVAGPGPEGGCDAPRSQATPASPRLLRVSHLPCLDGYSCPVGRLPPGPWSEPQSSSFSTSHVWQAPALPLDTKSP